MAQLGRITGPLLNANLHRDGVNLKFSNTTFDSTPVLFLDVENNRIGIKDDTPSFDLDINNDTRTTDLEVDVTAKIDNVIARANGTFTTVVGPLNIMPQTAGSYINLQRMRSDDLDFNDNTISGTTSNQTIELKPSGTGTVEVFSSTNIYGNLDVTGNISIDGNLTKLGDLIVGDELYNPDTGLGDTVEIVPDFTQSIIPGDDNLWDLGRDQLDSSPRRWSQAYVTDDLANANQVTPLNVFISDQTHLDGINNQIFATQSNDNFNLNPDTGVVFIENTKWETNNITNLVDTPLTFTSTGIGYLRFMGDNGFVIPAGDDTTRPQNLASPARPELGDTRWNTDENYLESFSGKINIVTAIGVVTGIPTQTRTGLSGATSGTGENATFTITITSGAISSVTVTNQGQSYVTGDTITILGTDFVGGSTPTNDITVTVGAQIDDGYELSTGGGAEVDIELMEDLGDVYSLMLG